MNKIRNPSDYPILIAFLLLAVTAATLAIGNEQLAERFVIYSYYFLVIGVVIRFLELWLPEDALQRLNPARKSISVFPLYIKQHGSKHIRNTGIMLKNLYGRLMLYLHRAILEMRVHISDFKKQHPPESIHGHSQEIGSMLKRQYLKMLHLHIVNTGKKTTLISEISGNIAIFLSVFLLISLIYGMAIDWWFVNRYLSNLIYAILGSLTLYIFLKVRF